MTETAKLIPAVWITKPAVADRLLPVDLRPLLDETIDRTRQAAIENQWPLTKIEIDYHQDMEFEWMEYLLVTLRFASPWEETQRHRSAFYQTVVKSMQQELGPLARYLFIGKISYQFTSNSRRAEIAKLIPSVWITKPAVADRLLGARGRHLLDEVIDRIRQAAIENQWPLTKIEIDYHQDMEFEWWEYLLLVLHFDCHWEEAQQHCDDCLDQVVDPFQRELGPLAKHLFIGKISYGFDSSS